MLWDLMDHNINYGISKTIKFYKKILEVNNFMVYIHKNITK